MTLELLYIDMACRHFSAEEVAALLTVQDPDEDECDDCHEVVTQDSDDELDAEHLDESEHEESEGESEEGGDSDGDSDTEGEHSYEYEEHWGENMFRNLEEKWYINHDGNAFASPYFFQRWGTCTKAAQTRLSCADVILLLSVKEKMAASHAEKENSQPEEVTVKGI